MCRNATRQKQVDFKPACKAMQVVKLFHILEHLKKTQALKSEHSFENGPIFLGQGYHMTYDGIFLKLIIAFIKKVLLTFLPSFNFKYDTFVGFIS